MSGTSLDGIDAAIIETDGATVAAFGPTLTVPYDPAMRKALRGVLGGQGPIEDVERDITLAHADVVKRLLHDNELRAADINVIGFHGHTVLHRPREGRTWQIGDGELLAAKTGIDVVTDFRFADVAAGGEGAPLAPLYHQALCEKLERPIAVLNIGGVANVTWVGPGAKIMAFDTGPGNALIDDWILEHTGKPYDVRGGLAASGRIDTGIVDAWLEQEFFSRPPPKSMDRDDFDTSPVAHLGTADGAATLTAMTCASVVRATELFPEPPKRWIVTGGGRNNASMVRWLAYRLEAPVAPAEDVGWDGDALEAQAFAFLAVRSMAQLPLSVPATTGASAPTRGGAHFRKAG